MPGNSIGYSWLHSRGKSIEPPNASCVVSLIDRLVHNSEIISIEAESYRLKEAKEQSIKRNESRAKRKNNLNAKKKEIKS